MPCAVCSTRDGCAHARTHAPCEMQQQQQQVETPFPFPGATPRSPCLTRARAVPRLVQVQVRSAQMVGLPVHPMIAIPALARSTQRPRPSIHPSETLSVGFLRRLTPLDQLARYRGRGPAAPKTPARPSMSGPSGTIFDLPRLQPSVHPSAWLRESGAHAHLHLLGSEQQTSLGRTGQRPTHPLTHTLQLNLFTEYMPNGWKDAQGQTAGSTLICACGHRCSK